MDKKKCIAIFIILFMSFFAYIVPDYGFTNNLKAESNLEYKTLKKTKNESDVVMYIDGLDGENISDNIIDTIKPEIELNGNDVMIRINDDYIELGAKASDNIDGDITNNIVINGKIEHEKGTYELKYTIKDKKGNENYIIRKVSVIDDNELYKNINNAINIVKERYDLSLIDKLTHAILIFNDKSSNQELIDNTNLDLEQEILNINQNAEIRSCFINKKEYIYQKDKKIYS